MRPGVRTTLPLIQTALVFAIAVTSRADNLEPISGTSSWSTNRQVHHIPDFSHPIENLTTPLGREAILSCTVDHLGKYKVGWLKAEDQTILTLDTMVVTQNSRISVSHDNHRTWQLHIRQVKETDRGCYMCQINTSIMKKQIGCVDVHVPPDIVYDETSSDMSVQEGENATLICKANGHPPPRITWRREDNEPIILRKGPRDTVKVSTYNGSLLYFWRLERKQMGAFLCIASNDVPPAVSKRIILNVNFAPVIKVPNQLLGAPLGTDVQLECYVEAFPNTINYWVKNRGEMLLDGPKYSIRENKSTYKVFMWLLIRGFNRQDIGTYNCVSTNSLGRAEGTLRLYGLAEASRGEPATRGNKEGQNESAGAEEISFGQPIHNSNHILFISMIILLLRVIQIPSALSR